MAVPQSLKDNRKAGRQWWAGFKQRYNLSVRSPEPTLIGRATAFNKHVVSEYFSNLAKVMDKRKFTPDRVFNLNETGVTTVQKPKRVVTTTETKNVGSATSAECGELVTAVYAICAAGYALPPMLIFPRIHFRDYFIRGGSPGCIGRATRSG